jgi:hypothetical protein
MTALKYLQGYPPEWLERVQRAIEENTLGDWLARRYPGRHEVRSDEALYAYTMALKQRYLRRAPGIDKVRYDGRLDAVQKALGLHTAVSRVHGGRLKAKKEIRVAAVFREGPPEFLETIVVHELAHLKELEHNKAFYQLCEHMLPDYHQREFDLRLYLTLRELQGARGAGRPPPGETP